MQVSRATKRRRLLRRIWANRWFYVMLLPGLCYFAVFKYAPLYGIQLAFKDYVLAGIEASPWNNFAHFRYMLFEQGFVPAFRNTLVISGMRILLGFPFPILLALFLDELVLPKYRRTVQTIYTFPHFLSWVLLAGLLQNLLGASGMVRKVAMLFSPQASETWNLLYDNDAYRWILVFTDIWKEAGWGAIIYLASIAGVDRSLYEAATIDGANRWQRIWSVTLPSIAPMIAIQFILRVGAAMEGGFDQVINTYTPPVYDKGDILDTYIYRLSFVRTSGVNLGFTTAVGLFKNVINFILWLMANSLTRALGQKTIL